MKLRRLLKKLETLLKKQKSPNKNEEGLVRRVKLEKEVLDAQIKQQRAEENAIQQAAEYWQLKKKIAEETEAIKKAEIQSCDKSC